MMSRLLLLGAGARPAAEEPVASVALVQHASVNVGNTETRNIEFGAALTAGNAVVVGFMAANDFTLDEFELHDGDIASEPISQTPLVGHSLGGADRIRWYMIADIPGGLDQVRAICTGWVPGLSVAYEVSGLGAAPTLDDDDSGSLSASSSPNVPIAPTVADAFAAVALVTSGTVTSVTDGTHGGSGGFGYYHQGARVVTASGAQAVEVNFSGSVTPNYSSVVIAP